MPRAAYALSLSLLLFVVRNARIFSHIQYVQPKYLCLAVSLETQLQYIIIFLNYFRNYLEIYNALALANQFFI